MKIKVGGYLTNLMVKNLKFRIGNHDYMLLKPIKLKTPPKKAKDNIRFMQGYITFNRGFIEDFVSELDKIHDLNLQLDRSLPMIYPPARWKSFFFGGYYLK